MALIDRQAVIDTEGLDEQIRCEMCRNPMHTDRGCDGNCKYDEKLYKKIMQILGGRIKPLPSVQPEPHWIPCSDKIPSEAQECWITAKDGTVYQGMFTRQYGERRDSGFICNNGFAWLNTVVAWMPYDMPEPYQKEGE